MSAPQHMVLGGGIAPVLIVPAVFEPALCARLIAYFEERGGRPTGAMYDDAEGQTVERFDTRHKNRLDLLVEDKGLGEAMDRRFLALVKPAIRQAYHIEVTRNERRLLARYDGCVGGHFSAHKDNTTKGTAHRQFACTINLNTDEFEGGALRFPAFGPTQYRCPTGTALIFSCSLLHEALPVTKGRRYAALPFFYDEASAMLRNDNARFVPPSAARP